MKFLQKIMPAIGTAGVGKSKSVTLLAEHEMMDKNNGEKANKSLYMYNFLVQ